MTNKTNTEEQLTYTKKIWIAASIIVMIVVVVALVQATFNVWLLILAGSLIAVYFRGLSGLIQRKTHWKEGLSVIAAIGTTLVLLVLLLWLVGAKVQSQLAELSGSLPNTVEQAKQQFNQSFIGQKLIQKISSHQSRTQATTILQSFFKTTFGVLGDLYVVLFIGIFFTASPQLYTKGIIKLVPTGYKSRAEAVLVDIGNNLKKWLKGKMFAMLVVFILTAIGLVILDMPMWLALALIAGVLNFIPNFGPLIALIPALLVGLSEGTSTAVWVGVLYIVVQVLESNFITPLVQQRLISIPPALIIIAQMLISPLTGGWGLVLATPLMVILLVLVNKLYIKPQQHNG